MEWTHVLAIVASNIVIFMTMIGITIKLHLYGQKRLDESLRAISDEMKDFHGRLVAIEAGRK